MDTGPDGALDYERLYEEHPEYTARRRAGSYEQAVVELEVRLFKLPNLLAVLDSPPPASVLEVGCATGELVAAFPVVSGGVRTGVDISPANIAAARERHTDAEFVAGEFRALLAGRRYDVVVLSDVLEHVPDDADFLRAAAALADRVLINLPLEDNWLNRGRRYGPDDVSGHLRRYTLADGLRLFAAAGLEPVRWRRVWIHETEAEHARRTLRAARGGRAYAGGAIGSRLRAAVSAVATAVHPLGRRLYASNLYALLRAGTAAAGVIGRR